MPEGDSLETLARALAPMLAGRRLDRLWLGLRDQRREVADLTVEAVSAVGKHLLLDFADGSGLRVHLGLYGTWHRYRKTESWRKPRRWARLILELGDQVHVCFNARELEWLNDAERARLRLGRRLGPDLSQARIELPAIRSRARALHGPGSNLADLLLDQRVAAGIGNVYKSETLFLAGRHPLTPVRDLDDDALDELFALAHPLLRANLSGGGRDTRGVGDGREHLWVFERGGRPCLKCGAVIRLANLGQIPRRTYWCPECQPEPVFQR